jgi:hypothetical protein
MLVIELSRRVPEVDLLHYVDINDLYVRHISIIIRLHIMMQPTHRVAFLKASLNVVLLLPRGRLPLSLVVRWYLHTVHHPPRMALITCTPPCRLVLFAFHLLNPDRHFYFLAMGSVGYNATYSSQNARFS